MQEKILIKISLITSLAGIILLIIVSRAVKPEISRANALHDGKHARIDGIVKSVAKKSSVTMIEVLDECSMKIVLFEDVDVKKGQSIEVIGKVGDYNGKKEIIAEEVRVW